MGPPPAPRSRHLPRRAYDAAARMVFRAGFRLLTTWWRVTHPTIEGVYVAVWHEGRVLLIRNSYRDRLSFPSGRRGRSEAPARAAARELREEVGISVPEERLVHAAEILVETPLVNDHVHVFELHLDERPSVAIDHREVVWADFETPERARTRELLSVPARYLAQRAEGEISPSRPPR